MAFSSKSELVDMLARRARPVTLVGDVPVMPRVVVVDRDSLRRCCSWMAAVVMAPGNTGVPAVATELDRVKSWEKGLALSEPRRLRCMSAGGGEGGLLLLELELSEDMMRTFEPGDPGEIL